MPTRKTSIISLKYLYHLSSILCQTPTYNFETHEVYDSLWDKIRGIAFAIFIIATYLDLMLTIDYSTLSITTIVLEIVSVTFFSASQLNACLSSSFWNQKKWRKFLRMFEEVDTYLKNAEREEKKIDYLFYSEVILGQIYCISMIIFRIYITRRIYTVQQIVFYNVLIYCIFISSLVDYNFAICLKHRYEISNQILLKQIHENSLSLFVVSEFRKRPSRLSAVQTVTLWGLFTTLNEISETFNEIFGWDILFLCVNIVLEMLYAFDSIVIYSLMKGDIEDDTDELIIINFLSAILYLVFGTIVIISCDFVTSKAKETASICYKILLEMPSGVEGREDLIIFAQQCSTIQTFSAAGFFDVNISILLSLLGVVASNLIIIIQLNQ